MWPIIITVYTAIYVCMVYDVPSVTQAVEHERWAWFEQLSRRVPLSVSGKRNADSTLGQRRRRWTSVESALRLSLRK